MTPRRSVPLARSRHRRAVEFVRFSIVGTSGIGVNLGVYYVLTRALSMSIELASPVAIEASILWNFLLNDRWTFGERLGMGARGARIGRFHVVCLTAGAVNYLLLLVLAKAGWWDIYANMCGIVAGATAKFFINSAWTWREHDAISKTAALSLRQGDAG